MRFEQGLALFSVLVLGTAAVTMYVFLNPSFPPIQLWG